MALADIPFYGAYAQRRQQNEAAPMQEIQQASGVMGLLQQMQQQQDSAKLKELVAASGGDVEKAVSAAIQTGNLKAAHELAPLAKLAQERRVSQETTEGITALGGATGASPGGSEQPQELGMGQPVALAGDQPPAPANPRQQRVDFLNNLSRLPKYANNPIVQQRIQAEIDKLVKPESRTRTYQQGEESITEEQQPDGSWKMLGRGPKFAKTVEAAAGPDNAAQPTADTLEMDAWRYLTDGTLPTNMGRGAQGSAQATGIRNRAAALAKDMGMSADEIRMGQLTNKTQVQAIGQLAKAKAQILQFEKTANMNADLALEASEKVDRTGVPLFNRWLQAGRTAIAGDVEAQKFNAANETFVSEYAKVMGGGYGASASTEGAQARAHTLLNTANTKEQYRGVVAQLKREMGNRVKALNGQMDEERQNLRNGVVRRPAEAPAAVPGAAAPAQTPAAPQRLRFDAQGNQIP